MYTRHEDDTKAIDHIAGVVGGACSPDGPLLFPGDGDCVFETAWGIAGVGRRSALENPMAVYFFVWSFSI